MDFQKYSTLYFYKNGKVGGSTNFDTLASRYISDITLEKRKPHFKYVLKIKHIPIQYWRHYKFVENKFLEFSRLFSNLLYHYGDNPEKKEDGGTELYQFKQDKKFIIDKFIDYMKNKYRVFLEYYSEPEIELLNQEFHNRYHNWKKSRKEKEKNDEVNIYFDENNLEYIDIDNIQEFNDINDYKDRPYQVEYIEEGLKELIENYRCLIELATGGGKTRIFYKILQKFLEYIKIDLVVVFSPRIVLNIQNTSDKYAKYYDVFNWNNNNNFEKWLNTRSMKQKLVVLCNNSANNLYERIKNKNLKTLTWFDEAHYFWDITKKDINKEFINYWLYNGNYKIFSTATPSDDMINHQVYGNHIKKITARELINLRYLSDINTVSFNIHADNYNLIYAINQTFYEHGKFKGLSYHKDQKNCKSLYEKFKEAYIQGKTDIKPFLYIDNRDIPIKIKDKQEKKFREYNGKSIMIVCQKVSFGYDNKDIDFIVFSDGKFSEADIKQCIGRGLRPDLLGDYGTNKYKSLTILLPIYIENINNEIEEKGYKNIIEIIKSLVTEYECCLEDIILNFSSSSNEDHNDHGKEYEGEKRKTELIETLCSKFGQMNTKKLINLLIEKKIYTIQDYKHLRTLLPYIKQNPQDYKDFKWNKVIDPFGKKYYTNLKECEKSRNNIIQNCDENEYEIIEAMKYKELRKYDNKIPPYDDLKYYF